MIGLRVSKAHIDITSAAFDDTAGAVPDLNGPTFPYLVQLNLVKMFFQKWRLRFPAPAFAHKTCLRVPSFSGPYLLSSTHKLFPSSANKGGCSDIHTLCIHVMSILA